MATCTVTVADNRTKTFDSVDDSAATAEEAEASAAAEAYQYLITEHRILPAGVDAGVPLLEFLALQGLKANSVDLHEYLDGSRQAEVVSYDESGPKAAMVAVESMEESARQHAFEAALNARTESEANAMQAAREAANAGSTGSTDAEDESAAYVGGFYLSEDVFATMQAHPEAAVILEELGVASAEDLRSIGEAHLPHFEPCVQELCECLSPVAAAKLRQCLRLEL